MTTWKIKTIICVSSYLAIAYLLLLWSTSPSYFFILLSNCMLVRRMMTNKSQITSPPPTSPKSSLDAPHQQISGFSAPGPSSALTPQLSAIKSPPPLVLQWFTCYRSTLCAPQTLPCCICVVISYMSYIEMRDFLECINVHVMLLLKEKNCNQNVHNEGGWSRPLTQRLFEQC